MKYHVYNPVVAKNQKKYVVDCLDTNMLTFRGKYISLVENTISKYLGIKDTIMTFNGSVSLNAILHGNNIGPGDEVISQSLTYAATVSQINLVGARAVLVDSDDNLQMNIDQVWKSINKKTKAILVAQLYADSPDMEKLVDICHQKKLSLLEDSAEAFACRQGNKFIGSFGKAASFSFFSNKVITFSEGGCVCTNDDELADKIRLYINQGHLGSFVHTPGTNFRMTNIQAAIGLAQLEELAQILNKKRKIAHYYRKNLPSNIRSIVPSVDYSSEWMPVFQLPDSITYGKFNVEMRDKYGIETRPIFTPVHLMEGFKIKKVYKLNNCEKIYKNKFNLPCYPTLSIKDLDYIIEAVNKVLSTAR